MLSNTCIISSYRIRLMPQDVMHLCFLAAECGIYGIVHKVLCLLWNITEVSYSSTWLLKRGHLFWWPYVAFEFYWSRWYKSTNIAVFLRNLCSALLILIFCIFQWLDQQLGLLLLQCSYCLFHWCAISTK